MSSDLLFNFISRAVMRPVDLVFRRRVSKGTLSKEASLDLEADLDERLDNSNKGLMQKKSIQNKKDKTSLIDERG